jgi:hypothetical protein
MSIGKWNLITGAAAVIVVAMVWAWVDIYLLEDGSVWTTASQEGDAVMRLEANGEDLRVYEFTPTTSPNKQCIFVAGNQGKGGLFCFDKTTVTPTR